MAAAESVAAKRSSYGVSFSDADSFQFDNFAQTLGAGLPSGPQAYAAGLVPSQNESASSPNLKQSPSKPGKSRNGFFRRMLVGGDSQSRRTTDSPDVTTEVEASPQSLRHRASNLFKKSNSSEKATSLNISSPVSSQARSPGRSPAIGQLMYRESVIASSATSLQEFLDLDEPSQKRTSAQEKALNPIISPSPTRNHPNQVSDTFIAKSSDRSLDHRPMPPSIPLISTELTQKSEQEADVQPPLARDTGPTIARFDSPKRPRIRQGNSENTDMGEDATDHDLSAIQAIKAKCLFERTDVSMHPEDYAAYLGKDDPFNAAVRMAFMNLFDFTGASIVNALRQMCAQLYIRGETQVIDRLIEAFAKRWRICNIEEKYLTEDVTYIIAFALITLNTDLHTAGLESDQKMKKSQFVQNTMHAIQSGQPGMSSKRIDPNSPNLGDNQSIRVVNGSPSTNSFREAYAAKENDTRNAMATVARTGSVRRSHTENHARATQIMMESRDAYLRTILEDLFVSVKNSQIQQPSFASQSLKSELNRTSSIVSRASSSGRGGLFRRDVNDAGGRTPTQDFSNNNSTVSFDQVNDGAISERSVSAYGRSVSMYTSQQSSRASIGSRASSTSRFSMRAPASTRAIGFVGSLANAMIREEATSPTTSDFQDVLNIQDKQDEELTLSGAPFAKEGRVRHKFQPKAVSRRGKQKGWSAELFAVLEKGQIQLFDFSTKSVKSNGQGVGGGDWTENARSVATFDLIQAIASTIPKEAQTKQRPYVWQLLLTNGDTHMFEVGTEHLIHEWTSTANYWAARVTKAPLRGAVDSAEYGWGQILDIAIDNENLEEGKQDQSAQRRPSQFSMSTSDQKFDFIAAQFPGNKVLISDWQPDLSFSLPSNCTPDEQLTALSKHLEDLRDDLSVHNKRRKFIPRAFSPKHANLAKAMANFERRSQYLQTEIFKYSSYVTALEVGIIRAKAVAGDFAAMQKQRKDSVASNYS